MRPLGITQGVAYAALRGPEELARRAGRHDVLRLGSNESPFGPSPKALVAMHDAAVLAHRYADPSALDLRSRIAARHNVPLECVAVGAGIDDLLGWTVRAYLSPGMPAIAAHGAFPTFEMHVNGFGAHLERVAYLADGRIDLDGFVRAAERLGGGLIFLPNPDNPSGTVYDWSTVLGFLDALPSNTLVIHDEAYANFLPRSERFPPQIIDPRVLRMRTFSKEYGLAGLRVGYVLAAPEAIAALDAVRLLYGVSRIAQAAALASLDDDDFMEDAVSLITLGREEYYRMGRRLAIPTRQSATNFVLFDFGDADRATRAVTALLAQGIHVRKPPVPPLDRFIRISVGSPAEYDALESALEFVKT